MKIIINSVGSNPIIIADIIKEICVFKGCDFDTIIEEIKEGKSRDFFGIPETRAREWYDRLVQSGATVELDKDTFLEMLIDKTLIPIKKVYDWEMNLYHKSKALGIVLFVIDAIALVVLVVKFWGVMLGLVFVLSVINIYNDKREHTDEEQREATSMLKKIGKWIVICLVIFLLFKPASLIVNRFMPGYPVRNGCLLMYSQDMTVGEAFDKTFANSEWSDYKENGIKYVVYTGFKENSELGEDEVWQFLFATHGERFTLDSIYMNGMDATWSEELVLYAIYERAGAIK